MIEVLSVIKEHRLLFGGGVLLASFMMCYALGVSNGRVPHVVECSEELLKQARLVSERDALKVKLGACEVKRAGGGALESSRECDLRIKSALEEAKTWACED